MRSLAKRIGRRRRLFDAIIVTPARLVAWPASVGTTFEPFFCKGLERTRMARLQQDPEGYIRAGRSGHRGPKGDGIIELDAEGGRPGGTG